MGDNEVHLYQAHLSALGGNLYLKISV